MLIMMAGLPASGKSTIAQRLAAQLQAVILDKDPIRAALFPPPTLEYSTQQDDFVVEIMLLVAEYLFQKDKQSIVILDGRPFSKGYQVRRVVECARRAGVPLKIIHCTCSDAAARERLSLAIQQGQHLAANRDFELYLQMKKSAEPIPWPHLEIDTSEELEKCVRRSLEYILSDKNSAIEGE